jgi:serine/threonine protein kinase
MFAPQASWTLYPALPLPNPPHPPPSLSAPTSTSNNVMHYANSHLPFIQKMHAIIDPTHAIEYPPLANVALLDVMQRCLTRDPRHRATMAELLAHPFLRPEQAALPGRAVRPPPTSGSVELSREQLQRLLLKVSAAAQGAGGANVDVDALSARLFSQLEGGTLSPEIGARRPASTQEAANGAL